MRMRQIHWLKANKWLHGQYLSPAQSLRQFIFTQIIVYNCITGPNTQECFDNKVFAATMNHMLVVN